MSLRNFLWTPLLMEALFAVAPRHNCHHIPHPEASLGNGELGDSIWESHNKSSAHGAWSAQGTCRANTSPLTLVHFFFLDRASNQWRIPRLYLQLPPSPALVHPPPPPPQPPGTPLVRMFSGRHGLVEKLQSLGALWLPPVDAWARLGPWGAMLHQLGLVMLIGPALCPLCGWPIAAVC